MKDTSEDLLERIQILIDEVFNTDAEFTRLCNVPHNFVTRAKSRGYLNPTAETLVAIKEGVHKKAGKKLRWEWLMEGEGLMLEERIEKKLEQVKEGEIDITKISVEDLIRIHPELNRKMSLLLSQAEMMSDFMKNFIPE